MTTKNETQKEKRTFHNPVTGENYPVAELSTRKDITAIWDRRKKKLKS